jgi:hypothetical protein
MNGKKAPAKAGKPDPAGFTTLDWFSTVLIRIFFWCKNLQIYKGGVALGSGS